MPDHPHSAIARRLKRANGHLETIVEMIEQGRPCAHIAQQLQAVESAIESAKKALIHDHLSHRTVVQAVRPERPGCAQGFQGDRQISVKYL
jgi:DNA-binding FrmR family transcriptional regulator